MHWRKLGHVYCPDGAQWWARTHTHLPTAHVMGKRIRVYFAGLDESNFGRIGYVDVDADNPLRVLDISDEPAFDVGEPGAFDDSGVVPSCVVEIDNRLHLYYVGFQRAERVPYMLFTGLAVSDDGATFTRYAPTPILDRTPAEPYSRGAPVIMADNGLYHMWYWSCLYWSQNGSGMHYNNVIRHAVSRDGIIWQPDARPCIVPDGTREYSIGRPAVVRDDDTFHMWYAVRAYDAPYAIGYAVSADGCTWTRRDSEAGIAAASEGWDAEMICYPHIVRVNGAVLMFYNGNGHGRTGFGCAVLER